MTPAVTRSRIDKGKRSCAVVGGWEEACRSATHRSINTPPPTPSVARYRDRDGFPVFEESITALKLHGESTPCPAAPSLFPTLLSPTPASCGCSRMQRLSWRAAFCLNNCTGQDAPKARQLCMQLGAAASRVIRIAFEILELLGPRVACLD